MVLDVDVRSVDRSYAKQRSESEAELFYWLLAFYIVGIYTI
jgi:hypothetical protein